VKSGKYRGGKHNSAADSEYCITIIHILFVLHLRTSEIWRSQPVSVKSVFLYLYLQDKTIKQYGYLNKALPNPVSNKYCKQDRSKVDVPRLHMVETASRYGGQLRMRVHRTNSRWQPTVTVREHNVAYTLLVFGFFNRRALRTAKQENTSIQQTLGPRFSDVDKSNLAFCAALSISSRAV